MIGGTSAGRESRWAFVDLRMSLVWLLINVLEWAGPCVHNTSVNDV